MDATAALQVETLEAEKIVIDELLSQAKSNLAVAQQLAEQGSVMDLCTLSPVSHISRQLIDVFIFGLIFCERWLTLQLAYELFGLFVFFCVDVCVSDCLSDNRINQRTV